MVTQQDIRKISGQIVSQFKPYQVILFGSYATGTPTPDSDVDLLVVMEDAKKPLHLAAQISAAVDHPFPLDILVYRKADFMDAVARKAVFSSMLKKTGVVLYEAGN